nr:Gfo/Idh/MocA family oxidoreductase [Sphingomonas sp. PR090111-T3T-6A]
MRYGMAGGGEGAFIGAVHRMAAALDGEATLVCGAFSTDGDRNSRTGEALGLPPARVYADIESLLSGERALPKTERMQALAIVTPNHLHAPMAIAALDSGFDVFSEKPMAATLAEANAIADAVRRSGRHYALAFTYAGYPMVEEARQRVLRGDFGTIRRVEVEYLQGWLSRPIDADGNKQAEWRTDPARAGLGGCLGDIGSHAFHLAEHVSGLSVEAISADLTTHVAGRQLDDDVAVLLRFHGGARGTVRASQVAAGEENGLRLRIHGTEGGLDWAQMEPNTLTLRWLDRPTELLRAAGPGLTPAMASLLRIPAGHPEGYIEAFANLYRAFGRAVRSNADLDAPGLSDGLRTMRFIDAAVRNSTGTEKWTPLC